jgi:hypothetical protein
VLAVISIYKANRYPKMILQAEKINIEALLNFAFRFNQTFSRAMLRIPKVTGLDVAKTAKNQS